MTTTKQRMQKMKANHARMTAKARELAQRAPATQPMPIPAATVAFTTDADDELNHPTAGKHAGMVRGYFRFDILYPKLRADEAPTTMIGFYTPGGKGGTTGEFRIAWEDIGDRKGRVPQLQVFEDGWSALAAMPDLIIEMGELDDAGMGAKTPICIQALLERLGFCDMGDCKAKMTPAQRAELQMLIG